MATTQLRAPADATYAEWEERVLARDQVGASKIYYDLIKSGRPVAEIAGQLVRIHAPYTHVPFHQRLDDGVPRFVNNDHCLLSIRASYRLMPLVSSELRDLPLAQSTWYIPTGLDPWNQLLGRAPGHYARMYEVTTGETRLPQVHWPDQEPEYLDVPHHEGLNQWLTLVQRGEVLPAYRVFLGLLEDTTNRTRLLAQLAFAGLIDVQDRMLFNRSYTTGHKSYRARATIEIGGLVGWDNAHSVVYAGVPDMAVGPRWYSTYEMACNVVQEAFEGTDHDLLKNSTLFTDLESSAFVDVLLTSQEPDWTHFLTALLKDSRKGPRETLDIIQLAAAENILHTHDPKGFSMPQHAYEYCNTVRWFLDTFDHPHQIKLLYIAAAFVNRAAHHQTHTPGFSDPRAYGATIPTSLAGIEQAILDLRADEAVALTAGYLAQNSDRQPLVELMANAATKMGNDPHNQELGLCLVEDYLHSTAAGRDKLLLAAAKHTAGHRKYGDPLEAYQRFVDAFN
jgi:hypothetical protein